MSKPVITVKDLSKVYRIGHERRGMKGTATFRDALTGVVKKPVELITGRRLRKEEFWALKDINFEVQQGDVLGIIGKNGSGKSTLLKILSQIVEPTTGEIHMRGKVASLLEVGTGFHPELTGRENIFFNGAILGMKRREIIRKFDEIVAFSEVEQFLDTPVKFYSSGMYVRLAFAVAAHLDPDILIVDEVLAVGDAAFQKKSLGKMKDVAGSGRTVLFVSHNMNSVRQLCSLAMYLSAGHIKLFDRVDKVIEHYTAEQSVEISTPIWARTNNSFDTDFVILRAIYLTDKQNRKIDSLFRNDIQVYVNIEADILEANPLLNIGYALYSEDGNLLYWSFTTDGDRENWPGLGKGSIKLRSPIPKNLLNEGVYLLEVGASLHNQKWLLEPDNNTPGIKLEIRGGLSASPYWVDKRPGILAPVNEWLKV